MKRILATLPKLTGALLTRAQLISAISISAVLTIVVLTSTAAHAEVGGYRVEVILFQNLLANLDAIEVDSLHNFSGVPELTDSSLPDELDVLTDKSERMEGIWRRLRNSKGYRPLVYASWVQNNIDYYPPFRIHDEVVIDSQLRAPTNIVVADLGLQDPLQAFRSSFYRLDGSVQLRLSRFLHINLDLEYRIPANIANRSQNATLSSPTANIDILNSSSVSSSSQKAGDMTGNIAIGSQTQELAGFDVYRLKQSRQVKTDRLQYFDSPWFGALILVIPIAAEPLLPAPQQAAQEAAQEAQQDARQDIRQDIMHNGQQNVQ